MNSIQRTRTNPSEQLTTQLKQMSCMRVGGGRETNSAMESSYTSYLGNSLHLLRLLYGHVCSTEEVFKILSRNSTW